MYIFLSPLRKGGIISEKGLLTPLRSPVLVAGISAPSRPNRTGRMINGQTVKKELSSIFRLSVLLHLTHIHTYIHTHAPPLSLYFSFSLVFLSHLSLIHHHTHPRTYNQRTKMANRQIHRRELYIISRARLTWIPLTVQVHFPSTSLRSPRLSPASVHPSDDG